MKKRILSMLLLVALLVTGIPVMAVSAADAEPTAPTNEDYAELYAKQENLVHLYMAFANGTASDYYTLTSEANGTWNDMVGNLNATIQHDTKASKKWTVGEKGGFTFSSPDLCLTNNQITFDVAAFKDAQGNWYDSYTVDSTLKVVNRQKAPSATFTWSGSNITATVDGDNTVYTGAANNSCVVTADGDVRKSTVTFAIAEAAETDTTVTVTYVDYGAKKTNGGSDGKTVTTTTVDVTIPAGETSVDVLLMIKAHQSFEFTIPTASGVSVTAVTRVSHEDDVKAQVQTGYAFGHLYALRWNNALGYDIRTGGDGFGKTRWASGNNTNAPYYIAPFVAHAGAHAHFVTNDGKALSLAVVKTTVDSLDNWSVYNGASALFEGGVAKGLSGAEKYAEATPSPKFLMMNAEQGTMYAVRVYNTALTRADINWNHFVDILAYNGADITGVADWSDDYKVTLATKYANVPVETELTAQELTMIYAALATTNYASLYVGAANGPTAQSATLVGLYTAFKNEMGAINANAAAGKWTNKMDGTGDTDATLKDSYASAAWGIASLNGGLSMGLTGTNWKSANDSNTGIVFSTDWAAYANLTVEEASVIVGAHTGDTGVGGYTNGLTFKIDLLRAAHHANLDCTGSERYNNSGLNMKVVYRANDTQPYHSTAGRDATPQALFVNNGAEAVGRTMSYIKTTDDVNVAYTIRHANGATFNLPTRTYTLEEYEAAKSGRAFYMFAKAAMDTYAVRVYNGLLTEAEMQYNHLIDLLAFYQVEVPATVTPAMLGDIAALYAATTFVYDDNGKATDYTAIKADLVANIAELSKWGEISSENYADLYIKTAESGAQLVGLFTAFRNEQSAIAADIAAGKWTNKMDNTGATNATLKDSSDNAAWGLASINGGLSMGLTGTNWKSANDSNTGIVFSTDWAAYANLTVEEASVIVGAHTGDTGVGAYENGVTFKIDLLRGTHHANLDCTTKEHYSQGGVNMKTVWMANTTVAWWQGARDATPQALFVNNGAAPVGRTMSYIKTTTDTAVTFTVRHANSATFALTGPSYTLDEYETAKSGRAFYMFAKAAMDTYAVRVYNGLLTEAEMQYNHLIDLLAFYQVEIPENVSAAKLERIAGAFAATTFVYDDNGSADDYSAVKARLVTAMDSFNLDTSKTAYDELYVQNGLIGLYTTFGGQVSADIIDGVWYNKVEDGANATLHSAKAAWLYGENGGLTLNISSKAGFDAIGATGAGIYLNEAWADLPNFTVETSSVAKGVYSDPTGGFSLGSQAQTGGKFEETFCLDMISSAHYFNLYKNNGLPMGFITRMEGVSTANWWTTDGRSTAYQGLINTVNGKASGNTTDLGAVPAGLTLTYTKKTDEANVTFGMNFSTGAAANIDAGKKAVGSYSYTLEDYATNKAAAVITTHKFSLYNRGMYDVYAIRVYNKVLNADELNWNHFVDLLAFYEIELPETIDNALFATLADVYATTPFVASEDAVDGYKYSQIKADLQNSFTRAITLVVDGNEQIYAAPSGSYELPAAIDGKTLFGWTDGVTSVAPGTTVKFSASVTYTALAVDAVTVDANAEATVIQDANENKYAAIRFNALVNKAQFQAMNAISGEGTMNLLEMGILIVPKAYVDGAGTFTKAALDAWYIEAVGENKIDREYATGAYLDLISAENDAPTFRGETETALILSGGFADFSNATIVNDPDFVAITYFEVDYDKDGETDNVIYGEYVAENTVSVYETLNAKLATCEEGTAEYNAIKAIVDQMAALKLPTDIDPDAGEDVEIV